MRHAMTLALLAFPVLIAALAPAQTGFLSGTDPSLSGLGSTFDLGDLDGTGAISLVGIRSGSWVRGTWAGGWSIAPLGVAGLPNAATGVRLEDLDGDGRDDLAVWAPAAAGFTFDVYAALSLGGGAFGPLIVSTGFPFWPDPHVRGADLDGDGNLDHALAGFAGVAYSVTILRGDDAGGYTTGPTFPAQAGASWCGIADVDGDGDPDLVTHAFSSVIQVFVNDGAGAFTPRPPQGTVGQVNGKWALGDVNGDGAPDVVISSASLALWYTNDGTGTFVAGGATPLPNVSHTLGGGALLEDLDLDGRVDLIVYAPEEARVLVCFGSPTGLVPQVRVPSDPGVGSPAYGIATRAGDVDGDGDADLVVSSGGLTALNVLSGTHPPSGVPYFAGCPGPSSAGLEAAGSIAIGGRFLLRVSGAPPSAAGFMVASLAGGFTRTPFACYLGVGSLDHIQPHAYSGAGAFDLEVIVPPWVAGLRVFVQDLQVDTGFVGGVGGSNGLLLVF